MKDFPFNSHIYVIYTSVFFWPSINLLLLSSSSFPLLSPPNAKPLVPLPDPDRVPEPPPKDKVAESHAGSSADEEPKGACKEEGTKKTRKKTKKTRVPAQRRLPIEAGGEARVVFGELTRRTRMRRVLSVGAMIASDN